MPVRQAGAGSRQFWKVPEGCGMHESVLVQGLSKIEEDLNGGGKNGKRGILRH